MDFGTGACMRGDGRKAHYRGLCHVCTLELRRRVGKGREFPNWDAARKAGLCGGTDAPCCPSFARKRNRTPLAANTAPATPARTGSAAGAAHPVGSVQGMLDELLIRMEILADACRRQEARFAAVAARVLRAHRALKGDPS